MILPNKTITLSKSYLGLGARILALTRNNDTVSSLWERTIVKEKVLTFQKFTISLDFLFILNLIKIEDGIIRKQGK